MTAVMDRFLQRRLPTTPFLALATKGEEKTE
jgi:hypothetical protein